MFTGMSHNSCIEQRSNQQSSQLLIIDQVEQIMLKTGAKLQRVKKGFCVECEVLVDYDWLIKSNAVHTNYAAAFILFDTATAIMIILLFCAIHVVYLPLQQAS